MISHSHKFIYIHVPKTGGTSIQDVLLPFSEDSKVLLPFQDGIDSFEVRGPLTLDKHVTLADYHAFLGDKLYDYRIVTSVRHPLYRAVSGYFSPHKWMREEPDGSWKKYDPVWNETLFKQLLAMPNHRPATEYLRLNDHIHPPDIVIRHENFEADLQDCLERLGLPAQDIPRRNASSAPSELFQSTLKRSFVQDRVTCAYEADLEFFGYAPCSEVADTLPAPPKSKVFGVGFHKTATTSLATALNILGYRVTGPNNVFDVNIGASYRSLTRSLSHGYDAFQDNPWPFVFREMDAQWPDAKFVLTTRDPEKWLSSVKGHFKDRSTPMRETIYGLGRGAPLGHEQHYVDTMLAHNAAVREHFKDRPGKLLEIDIEASGDASWPQLCDFLDCKVPDQHFPHRNRNTEVAMR